MTSKVDFASFAIGEVDFANFDQNAYAAPIFQFSAVVKKYAN